MVNIIYLKENEKSFPPLVVFGAAKPPAPSPPNMLNGTPGPALIFTISNDHNQIIVLFTNFHMPFPAPKVPVVPPVGAPSLQKKQQKISVVDINNLTDNQQ